MGFKINVDRFGFAKKPEPEKVSRDYAAEYAKSLVEKEAKVRNERDIELHNEIIAEGNARRTKDEELEGKINNALTEAITYTNDAVGQEEELRTKSDTELRLITDALNERLDNVYTKDEVDGKIGSIDVDLSGYYTKEQTDDVVADVWTFGIYALESRINDLENSYDNINDYLDDIIAEQVKNGGDSA